MTIFGSLVMRFADDFHSWLRHSWKSSANRLTRDPKIVIHGNSCIILYFLNHRSGDKKKRDLTEAQIFSRRLWTAPELLRMGIGAPPAGTQKGDIYSLAIVMLEILYRAPPYYWDDLAPEGQRAMAGAIWDIPPKLIWNSNMIWP